MRNITNILIQNGLFYALAMLIAFGLKAHYSRASSDDLDWILRPTAGLVAHISGIEFARETGAGYVNLERRVIIAPACAGVNFLIIAFCTAAFSYLHDFKRSWVKLAWVGGSLGSAYLLTLSVNALRICLAMTMYQAELSAGWFTPARLHRLEGLLIYFAFLYAYYALLQKSIHQHTRSLYAGLMPLCWYSAIMLGVPLLTAAYRGNARQFGEHCGAVLLACGGAAALIGLAQFIRRKKC